MTTLSERERAGVLLHAKHALAPNSLGYCGPDEDGKILEHLRTSTADDGLVSVLARFEAAYPFVRMIADSTGRKPFDYSVTEAYWIGNSLLDRVQPSRFFEFAHQDLKSPVGKDDAKALFSQAGLVPRPHHSFYVMTLFGRSDGPSGGEKLTKLMDSCRISWGRVAEVREKELVVETPRLEAAGGELRLSRPATKVVRYDGSISPLSSLAEGDFVSLHWDTACEKLTNRQLRNIRAYTLFDISAANRFARATRRAGGRR